MVCLDRLGGLCIEWLILVRREALAIRSAACAVLIAPVRLAHCKRCQLNALATRLQALDLQASFFIPLFDPSLSSSY